MLSSDGIAVQARMEDSKLMPDGCMRIAFLASILLICLSGFVSTVFVNFDASDDYLFFGQTGLELAMPQATADQTRLVTRCIKNGKASENFSVRWKMRGDYSRNYLATAVAQAAAVSTIPHDTQHFAQDLPVRWISAASAVYAILMVTLLVMALWPASLTGWMAMAFALAASAIIGTGTLRGDQFLVLRDPVDFVANLIRFLINAGPGLSPFSFAPRGMIVGAAAAIFLIRWQKRQVLSYWLIFGLLFVHNSMAGLFLAFILAIDCLARTRSFLNWRLALPAVLGVALYLSREKLFMDLYQDPTLKFKALAVVIVFAAIVWLFRKVAVVASFFSFVDTTQQRIRNRLGEPGTDLLAFGIVWLGTLPLGWLLASWSDPTLREQFLVWEIFHGRVLAIFRPVLLLGFAMIVIPRFLAWSRQTLTPRFAFAAMVSLCVLSVGPDMLDIAVSHRGWGDIVKQFEDIDHEAQTRQISYLVKDDEAVVRFAIAKSAVTGKPVTAHLLAKCDGAS